MQGNTITLSLAESDEPHVDAEVREIHGNPIARTST